MKQKSDVITNFPTFFSIIKNQFGIGLKKLELIMLRNTAIRFCHPCLKKKNELYMSPLVLTHLTKIRLLNGKMVTC